MKLEKSSIQISINRIIPIFALLIFAFSSFITKAVAATPQSSAPDDSSQNQYVSFMLNSVNNDRSQYGSPPVEPDSKLQHLAQVYAEYLLRSGTFGHVDPFGRNPQDRAALFGINTGVSENLAWESSNYEGASIMINRAESSMMAEPPNQMNHRFNILNPRSRYIGIGVARDGDKIMMVQEFTEQKP